MSTLGILVFGAIIGFMFLVPIVVSLVVCFPGWVDQRLYPEVERLKAKLPTVPGGETVVFTIPDPAWLRPLIARILTTITLPAVWAWDAIIWYVDRVNIFVSRACPYTVYYSNEMKDLAFDLATYEKRVGTAPSEEDFTALCNMLDRVGVMYKPNPETLEVTVLRGSIFKDSPYTRQYIYSAF